MKNLSRVFLIASWAALLLSAVLAPRCFASTTFVLPNPAITVTPNYSNITTIVTIGTVTWKGPSAFYYVSECTKPDSTVYHCNVLEEDGVTLTAPGHDPMSVSLQYQDAAILIRSGHNYWRQSDTLLNGTVTLP